MNKLSILFLTGLLGACSLAPTYQRPAPPVAESYPHAVSSQATQSTPLGWKTLFKDPRLQSLINLGLESNRDLRVATLNIEQARAQYRIQRSDLIPKLNATGSITRQRSQGVGLESSQSQGSQVITAGNSNGQVSNLYNVGIGLSSYEVDLFGRVRNLEEAALNEYLAMQETQQSVKLSLIAEIATAYLNQCALNERLVLTKRTVESRQRGLDLIRQRFDYGIGSELDLNQAQTLLETAASDLAALERSVAQADNTLTQLIGQPLPGDLPAPLPLEAQGLDQTLPAGLPANLLTRRPDIRAAEARLKANYANIGAARAAFFPSITLTATTGFSSSQLSGLFDSGNRSWSFMPQITVPIFTGGRNRAQLDVAKIRKDITVAEYEKTIQTAFKEVSDELVSRQPLQRQLQAQERLRSSAARSLELAEQRYQQGLDDYLTQLDSQRSLYQAENTLVDAKLQLALSQINLFKSLGGDWAAY